MKKLIARIKSLFTVNGADYTAYYKNGNVKVDLHYLRGRKHGVCHWYNEDGVKIREAVYSMGKLIYTWYA